MNVWIWGPAMWEILHASSYIYDANRISIDPLVRPLRVILPCRFCRESFYEFYNVLQVPKIGQGFAWTYSVHSLVNKKLWVQKIEKFMLKNIDSVEGSSKFLELFDQPSLEVVQKRVLVNSDEPILWRSLSIVLLALTMSNAEELALEEFVRAIGRAIQLGRQANADELIAVLNEFLRQKNRREFIENLKYHNGPKYSELIRAGACVSGTCK